MVWVGAALAALGQAGCTPANDPHHCGLFGGIAGLSSGSYQQRLDQRRAQIDAFERANEASASGVDSQSEQVSQLQGQRSRLANDLRSIQMEADRLDRQAKTLQANNPGRADLLQLNRDIEVARARLFDLQQQVRGAETDVATSQRELDVLHARLDALQSAYLAIIRTR